MLSRAHSTRLTLAALAFLLLAIAGAAYQSFTMLPCPGDGQECGGRHNAHKEEADPRSPEERVADYTLALNYLTGVLALVAIFQGVMLIRGDRTATRAISLARDEFNSTHRPRLHVRNIVVKGAPDSHDVFVFSPNEPIRGQFYVSNIGSGDATIVESHCEVFWSEEGLPMERPYEGKAGNNPLPIAGIASGSSTVGQFGPSEPFPGVHWDLKCRSNIYVMGWVEYTDARNVRRRTAFCRRYIEHSGSRRFYPVDDPDYEHEE